MITLVSLVHIVFGVYLDLSTPPSDLTLITGQCVNLAKIVGDLSMKQDQLQLQERERKLKMTC